MGIFDEFVEQLKQDVNEDEDSEDNYHGGSGWVIVAVGLRGRSCVVAVDPAFGAMRFEIWEGGLEDPDGELGLSPPEDPGLWRAEFKAVTSRCPETGYPDGIDFLSTTDWRPLSEEERKVIE